MSELQSPNPYLFDLDGGRLCLDFANTHTAAAEHMATYADLLAFATQSQAITPQDAHWLHEEALREPAVAQGVMVRATRLREALRDMFLALAASEPLPEAQLGLLNFDLAASLSHARVVKRDSDDGYRWGWSGRNLDAPLWPITRSAADLLTSDEERGLVRECGASNCRWLFIDSTRNRSRQWCSMQSCGNREKARRHYQRLRGQREPVSASGAAGQSDAVPPVRATARRKQAAPSDDASATAG